MVENIQNPDEIADQFAKKFKPEPMNIGTRETNFLPTNFDLKKVIQFTPVELKNAIKQIKRGKSPGHDNLSIEHVVCAGDALYSKLCTLFNMCIRYSYLPVDLMKTTVIPIVKNKTGDLSDTKNYRPISLGTVIGKVLERLLQPELQKSISIDDAQFGFRPGLSTDSAIFSLKHTVQYYTQRNTSIYACFLDLSRAFDLVNYNVLWSKLQAAQVPTEIVSLLRYWYGGQINHIRWGDATSRGYRLDCGVRQGGLTSPDLFNVYINDLIRELRDTRIGCHLGNVCVNNLSYADDMVLLSPSISGLRKLLSICGRYANDHGLKYNVSKSEMMVFKAGKGPEKVPQVYLNGSAIREVQQFKYLGHVLTGDLKDDLDIERERRALSVRCNMLARRFTKCSKDVKLTLFRAYCQCFYTCQLWTKFKRSTMSTIRVQYNDAYRILMRLPRYCSASSMFAEAGVYDFFAIIRNRISSFWDRLRQSNNGILEVIADQLTGPIFSYWRCVHRNANKK